MTEENQEGLFSCKNICWMIGALIGIATYLILSDKSAAIAIIGAIIIGIAAALLLQKLFCTDESESIEATAPTSQAADASVSSATSSAAAESAAPAAVKAAEPAPEPTPEPEPAPEPEAKPAAKPAAKPKSTAAKKPAAKKPAAKKPAAKKAAAKPAEKPAAKAAAKPAAKSTPARKPVAKDGKPETLKKARAGGADDLKQIKGVGPGLEKTLNELGFYHFDQIAGWRKKEVAWVDERLKFKGRIERDDWIKQARALAKAAK